MTYYVYLCINSCCSSCSMLSILKEPRASLTSNCNHLQSWRCNTTDTRLSWKFKVPAVVYLRASHICLWAQKHRGTDLHDVSIFSCWRHDEHQCKTTGPFTCWQLFLLSHTQIVHCNWDTLQVCVLYDNTLSNSRMRDMIFSFNRMKMKVSHTGKKKSY